MNFKPVDIYGFGGCTSSMSSFTNIICALSIASQAWRTLAATLPANRCAGATSTRSPHGTILYTGGYYSGYQSTSYEFKVGAESTNAIARGNLTAARGYQGIGTSLQGVYNVGGNNGGALQVTDFLSFASLTSAAVAKSNYPNSYTQSLLCSQG